MKKLFVLLVVIPSFLFSEGILFSQSSEIKPDNPLCWRWEKMMPEDMTEALKKVPVAYLVISPLEWHGEAMSFGTDPAIGTYIGERAWRETGGVLIPTIYLGSETEYKEFSGGTIKSYWGMEVITREINPGSIYISNYLVGMVLQEILTQIERTGFKACVIVSGHGGYEYVDVIKGIEKQFKDRPMKVIYSNLVQVTPKGDFSFKGSGGHADFAEASNLGGIDPQQVDKSLFGKSQRDQKIGLSEANTSKIDYAKGKASVDFRAYRIAETVKQFLKESK
jgi:creatinine amidohydrolase/Fe(II)-dependent formamide hydrolase-like protein